MPGGCWIQIASSNNAYFDNTLVDDIIIRSGGNESKIFISPIKTSLDSATMCIGSNSVNVVGDASVTGNISSSGLTGLCISGNVNSTASNVAASSLAVKTTYDLATTANTTANAANTAANDANTTATTANTTANAANTTANAATTTANAALPKTGGAVSGDITLSVVGAQVLGAASDAVGTPSFSWTGDDTTGVYRSAAGSVGISTTGVNRATINASGLTVVGAVAATNINATTITGTCVSQSTSSFATDTVPSSAALKTTYDLAVTANTAAGLALPKAGGTVTGDVILSGTGTQVLGDGADNVATPSFSWNGDATTGVYSVGAGSVGISTTGVNRATINSTGFSVDGALDAKTITGTCISSLTNYNSANTAASSSAVKTTYDLANTANTTANAANTTANAANSTANAALPKTGGAVSGDITLSTVGTQVLGAASDAVATPSFSWTGDLTTGVYRSAAGSVGISTTGVNRATVNASGLTVVGSVNAPLHYGNGADTATAPSYSWSTDTNTGIWNAGADQIGFSTGGVNRATISSTGLNASALTGCISDSTSSTLTNIAASSLAVKNTYDLATTANTTANAANTTANAALPKVGGTVTGDITLSTAGVQVLGSSDAVATPSFSWTGDTNTGVYRVGTGSVGITTSGANRATINSTGLTLVNDLNSVRALTNFGNVLEPTHSFTNNSNTGMYRVNENIIGFSTGGSNRMTIGSSVLVGDEGVKINPEIKEKTLLGKTSFITASPGLPGAKFNIMVGGNVGANTEIVYLSTLKNDSPGSEALGNPIDSIPLRITSSRFDAVAYGEYNIATASNCNIGSGTAFAVRFNTGGTIRAFVDSNAFNMDNVWAGAGSATNPSYSFGVDSDTGIYRGAVDTLGFSTAGVERLCINPNGLIFFGDNQYIQPSRLYKTFLGKTTFSSGAGGGRLNIMPGGGSGANNKIIYLNAIDADSTGNDATGTSLECLPLVITCGKMDINSYTDINLKISGTNRAIVTSAGVSVAGAMTVNAGSQESPSLSFNGALDTGVYATTSQLGLSLRGIARIIFTLFHIVCAYPILATGNGPTAPAYSFNGDQAQNTGMYQPAENEIGFSTGGGQRVNINGTGMQVTGTITANGTTLTSDDRVKTEEEFITNALDTVDKLRPQIYNKHMYIDYTNPDDTITRESGLIAQEIYYDAPELRHLVHVPEGADQAALDAYVPSSSNPTEDPEMYNLWGSNLASVNYVGLVPYLVKSIQELRVEGIEKDSEIITLNDQINVLNDQATAMNTQYNDLLDRILALENK